MIDSIRRARRAAPVPAVGAAAVALAAAALGLAACGSSGGSQKGSVQARRAIGREALLVLDDLPGGWRAKPTPTGVGDKVDGLMASCLHRTLVGDVAGVYSSVFERRGADPEQVQNSVSVEASTAAAEARYALYKLPGTTACLRVAFGRIVAAKSAQASGVVLGRVGVRLLTVISESDAAIGYRVTIPITMAGHTVSATADLVVMRVGRATTDVVYEGLDGIDAAMEKRLNIAICLRLRAALAAHT